jgi:two-component system chemotaxis sensor kinase CheA
MKRSSDDRATELRQLFFEGAAEHLEAMNAETLRLEKDPADGEALRSLRRAVHTLKGDAATCGYRDLSELAHQLEDALALEGAAPAAVVEAAFAAADVFDALLKAHREETKPPSTESLRKQLRKCKSAADQATPARRRGKTPAAGAAWSEYEQLVLDRARSGSVPVVQLRLQLDPACAMPEAALQMVRMTLSSTGELLALQPQDAKVLTLRRSLEAAVVTSLDASALISKCHIPGIIRKVTAQVLPALPSPVAGVSESAGITKESVARPAEPAADATNVSADSVLRVEAGKIDSVLNLVGELVIGRSMLQQVLLEMAAKHPKDPVRMRLADVAAFQSRVLNDLQRSMMQIRMVPVEQLFRRFPRMVRDVARQCGKQVDLIVSGQDTDLDKSILDALAEPIAHLVRNAISHGLGTVEQRRAAGKPETGAVRLSAYHQANQVVIEVSDDGRGLDPERIRAKAIEQGLTDEAAAARLSEAEILEFIFRPGFSTAAEVTEVSGRGVGMDVVQTTLHRLKGSVTIETNAGQGTTFRLRLPLTLAIIQAILFRVEQRLYAVPLSSVVEMTRAFEHDVHRVDGQEVLQLRNRVLPLVRLGHAQKAASPSQQRVFVLVVALGGKNFGLVVDEVAGQEELVIKALDTHLVTSDLISGASILGDGRVVLILNLAAIVERIGRMRPETGDVAWGLLLPTTVVQSARRAAAAAATEVQP